MRNNIVHAKGECGIENSVNFLERYLQQLNLNCRVSKIVIHVLKIGNTTAACHHVDYLPAKKDNKSGWSATTKDWIKINIDTSFVIGVCPASNCKRCRHGVSKNW